MKQGIYEQVINNEIITELEALDINNLLISKEDIHNEEAKVVLSQYIEGVIRKSLNYIRDKEKEDVDIPEINTVLFLRPTESLTVFLQQLGRGLRLSEGKECLTVLDFVGQAHKNYNFEEKFRALIGKTNHPIKDYIENGFLTLHKSCYIQLEKQSKEYILRNIKSSANNKANLIVKLKNFILETDMELNLENFLNYYHLSLVDFYGKSGERSFSRMLVIAELKEEFYEEQEKEITKKLKNLFNINSRRLINFILNVFSNNDIFNNDLNEEEILMITLFTVRKSDR